MGKEFEPIHEIVVTDPGIDDALGILVAQGGLKNPAYIATYGNASTEQTYANLTALGEFIRLHVRDTSLHTPLLFAGARHPSTRNAFTLESKYGASLDFIHGLDAMEGKGLQVKDITSEHASHNLYSYVSENQNKVDVISFGALTEIETILTTPGVSKLISSITIMGGALREPGNVEPHLEANFRHDPQALKEIIRIANRTSISLTFVPLDVTHSVALECTPERMATLVSNLNRRGSPHIASYIHALTGPGSTFFHFYTELTRGISEQHIPYNNRSFCGPPLHDLTALMVHLHPELFVIVEKQIKVITTGEEAGSIGEAMEHMNPDGMVSITVALKNEEAGEMYWQITEDILARTYT